MTRHTYKVSNKPKIKGFTLVDNFNPTPSNPHYHLREDNNHTPIGFVREDVVAFDTETLRHTITFTKLTDEVLHYD